MDAKITKLRLSRMLSYDWLKIVGTAAAVIIVWVLIFTMTATRITPAQTFTICNYMGNNSLSNGYVKSINDAYKDGIFTGEVLELSAVDLPTNGEYAGQVLEARIATDEGDLMFVSQQPNVDTAYVVEKVDETTGETVQETLYGHTYLETFLSGYRFKLHDLSLENENGYFNQMERYLNVYYTNGYTDESSLDTKKVEEDFLARIKRTKDKRYKKQEQIQKGVDEAIDRIQKYQKALVAFYQYLEKGVITLTKTNYVLMEGEKYPFEGTYSLNLCPNTETMGKLSSIVSYSTTYLTEEGTEEITASAKDMNVCFFNMNGEEEEFRYEALLYVIELVESVYEPINDGTNK